MEPLLLSDGLRNIRPGPMGVIQIKNGEPLRHCGQIRWMREKCIKVGIYRRM